MGRGRGLVLVVEDDAETRLAYRTLLEHEGWEVAEAADGEDALRQAAELLPQAVVVDISIPVVDGFETTRRLRLGDSTRGVPVLLVTGHALDADRQRAREVGCDGYLVKPIAPRDLLAEVERLAAPAR
jgi:two-component system cell cycle response regulator DivK